MGSSYGNWFDWGLGGGIMMIIFWVVITLFIVWIVREVGGSRHSTKTHRSAAALKILEERYAKGEIDIKEFEKKKSDLNG